MSNVLRVRLIGRQRGMGRVILNVRNEFISFNVEFCYGVSGVPGGTKAFFNLNR
jgi:hypothetical protein